MQDFVSWFNDYFAPVIDKKAAEPRTHLPPSFSLSRAKTLERVLTFIADVQKFERIYLEGKYPIDTSFSALSKMSLRSRKIYGRITKAIYKARPLWTLGLPTPEGWSSSLRFDFGQLENKEKSADHKCWMCLIAAATNGMLRKVRRCVRCKLWFEKKREEIHKYCSPECRDKAYRASPMAKKRNAERQRRFRANVRRRDSENLRIVKERKGQ